MKGTKKAERPNTKDMAGPIQVTLRSEWVKTPILTKFVSWFEGPFLSLELR
jgi:hypothetical protein